MENYQGKSVWLLGNFEVRGPYKIISITRNKGNNSRWAELEGIQEKIRFSNLIFSEFEAYKRTLRHIGGHITEAYWDAKYWQKKYINFKMLCIDKFGNQLSAKDRINHEIIQYFECSKGHHHKNWEAAQKCEAKELSKRNKPINEKNRDLLCVEMHQKRKNGYKVKDLAAEYDFSYGYTRYLIKRGEWLA